MTEYELLVQIVSSMKPAHWHLLFDMMLFFLVVSAIFNFIVDVIFSSALLLLQSFLRVIYLHLFRDKKDTSRDRS